MKKIFRIFIPILAVCIFIVSCGDDGDDEYNKNIIVFGSFFYLLETTTYTLTDNNNGTLLYAVRDVLGNIKRSYTVKKCLQGQAYRSAENDCRGTGSSADGWGAVKLQYCSTDDNACNPMGQYVAGSDAYVHGANSQIFVTCDSDTTAGLKWYPFEIVTGDDDINLFKNFIYEKINNSMPADYGSVGIWQSNRYLGNTTKAFYVRRSTNVDYPGNFFYDSALKSSLKYTLCGTYIPN